MHQQLFADLMDAAGLDSGYLAYLDDVPADVLASVNLMSLFGLHRELRGAAIGHFASTETRRRRARGVWSRHWSGWAHPSRASVSTANTSRPTRSTNKWYALTS